MASHLNPHGAIGQPSLDSAASPSSPSLATTSSYLRTPNVENVDISALIAQARSSALYHKQQHAQAQHGLQGVKDVWAEAGQGRASTSSGDIWGNGGLVSPAINSHHHHLGSPSSQSYPQSGSVLAPSTHLDPSAQAAQHLSALQGLLAPLLSQGDELARLRKEVEVWRGEWGRAERECRRLEGVVQQQQKPNIKVGPGFTAVLIDGDGLIFQDHLLQSAFQGGQLAARTLLSSLPRLVASASANDSKKEDIVVEAAASPGRDDHGDTSPEIGSAVVMVFVNKSGLGNTLVKAGVVPTWGMYESFWQGFSSAHELFTVIDVGPGKEASDAKIREYLRLFAKNAQCETLVLGASHDNGYANVLSSLQTENRLSKLLLLKGYSDLAGQLRQYSSRVVSIPDLFRTEKLPTTFASIAQTAQTPAKASAAKAPAKQHKAVVVPEEKEREEASEWESEEGSVEVLEWAALSGKPSAAAGGGGGKSKGKDKKAGGMAEEASKMKGAVTEEEWTEAKGKKKDKGSRKDKEGGKGGGAKGVKVGCSVRELKPRPCHTFYLSEWGCKAGEGCEYGHHYDLNPKQKDELSRLAKEILCPYVRNNKCRFSAEDCVYGHMCPRGEDCSFGETCRFRILPNGHGELDRLAGRLSGTRL